MAVTVDVKALLEAGAHFGHKTSRWHPKMSQYIHSKRGDIHVIDLIQTKEQLDEATAFVTKVAAGGKQVLFVGTKRQIKDLVEEAAGNSGQPYVTERWLGGMLTNQKTMNGRLKHLKSQEEKMESGELASRYAKLEVQRFQEEIDRLNHIFGGMKSMQGTPGAVVVTDVNIDDIAVKEARKLGVPVIALVDTNCDPSDIDYPIAANDDAIKSVQLILSYIVEAVNEGKTKAKVAPKKDDAKSASDVKKSSAKASKEETKKPSNTKDAKGDK